MTETGSLRQARIDAGLELLELATKAGVSRSTIEKAERGIDPIRRVLAVKIINALNKLGSTQHTIESLGIRTIEK